MKISIIKLVFVACLIALCYTTSAQQVKWDSTYRPDIYPVQLDVFRAAKHSKKDIVFLGNSVTFWGNWTELLNMKHIKNRGIPGDITFGVIDRLDEVIEGQPRKVFILIGCNDIARNIPDSVILQNYRRIIRTMKMGSPRTKIFFQSILPVNPSFGRTKSHYKPDRIKNVNAGLKKITEEEKVGFIDLYAAFADAEGNLPAQYSYDGLHLVKAGYDKWAGFLREGGYLH